MKIGMLGTGAVGRTIPGRLVELGHEVAIGAQANRSSAPTRRYAW
jgi:predicted dinucleotide-binding enzyme